MFDITKNKASRAYIHNLANQLVKNKDLRGFEPYLGEYMPLEERGNFSLLCKSSEKKVFLRKSNFYLLII